MLPVPVLIIVNCWIIFILYWIATAFFVKATAERKSFVSSLIYRIPLIIGGIILGGFHWAYPMNLRLLPHTIVTAWAGATICMAGLGFTIWARTILGRNWSSEVRFKQGHELVTTGPYRFVRHPIYTGVLLMCLGPAIQIGQLHCWLGTVVIGIGLWIKLKQEEQIMLQHFAEYEDYRKRVKALVPFVI